MTRTHTSPPHASPVAAQRGRLVWSLIILSLLMFVVMFALLYRQWVKYREPEFEVVVVGSHYFDGAVINIESVTHDRKLTATFGEIDRTELPFFLPAGRYTLEAKFKDGTIGPVEINLPPPDGRKFLRFELLTNESAATRPNMQRQNPSP